MAISIGAHQCQATGSVTILSSSSFIDAINYHHIVGEVQNNGAQPLQFVQVTATYYNNTGTVIDTEFTYTLVDIVQPGAKSPFEILLTHTQLVPQIDHYALQVAYEAASTKPQGIQILSNSSYTDTLGYLNIAGEAKNLQTQNATFTEVIATLYNSTGTVIGCGYTYTNPDSLEPNQTAPFQIIFSQASLVPNVTRYQLTAQSQEYSIIPENPAAMILTAAPLIILAALKTSKRRVKAQT